MSVSAFLCVCVLSGNFFGICLEKGNPPIRKCRRVSDVLFERSESLAARSVDLISLQRKENENNDQKVQRCYFFTVFGMPALSLRHDDLFDADRLV